MSIAYWKADSAAAWDKCEERRLENLALEAKCAWQATMLERARIWLQEDVNMGRAFWKQFLIDLEKGP